MSAMSYTLFFLFFQNSDLKNLSQKKNICIYLDFIYIKKKPF